MRMQESWMRRGPSLKMGKVYRLTFPGIAARVIEPPANVQVGKYPYLVESLILRSRWWVNERGEPDNIHSPHLIVAPPDEGMIESTWAAPVGASTQGQLSGGK
jgi:hypothetical protein